MTKGISCLMKSICSCLPNSDRSGYDLKNVAKNASNKPEVELSSIWYTEERKGIETSVRKASTADRPQTACAAEHRTEGEINQDDSKINEWQAGWNIANVIQGMFTMSYPYAIRYGGFWAIFSMIAVPYISCYTGKILVACLYELNERGQMERVRNSYVDIAQSCLGEKFGSKLINVAQIIELLMTCVIYIVVCGDLMNGSFPASPVDLKSWMMISTAILLPCAFLKKLTVVSWLNFGCTLAFLLINVTVVGYCLFQSPEWQWSKIQFRPNISMFPVTLGIVVSSYTSQIFLPTLEDNMKDRSKFRCMLNWSYISAAIFKTCFALFPFLTWGEKTQEVITNNLPTEGFKATVNLILVVKALLSYPLQYYVAIELLESALFQGQPNTWFSSCYSQNGQIRLWASCLKVLLVIFTLVLGVLIPHFALLMGLIGSLTAALLAFILPCYFHMKLKFSAMNRLEIAWEIFIIFLGILYSIIGLYSSTEEIVSSYYKTES